MTGSATPNVQARYIHPQGSIITVYDNGAIVKVNPAGKVVATSATADKLAAGHGGWTLIGSDTSPTEVSLPISKAAPTRTLLPMKFKEAKVSELPRYATDDDWVLQQKLDGIRAQLVFEAGKLPWFRNGTGGQLASDTARPITDAILRRLSAPLPDDAHGYTVDGEVVGRAFWAFDLICDGDERDALSQRLVALEAWHEALVTFELHDVIRLLPTARTIDEKQALAEAVFTQGGEGWIAKRLDGAYNWGARVEHSLKLKITHTIDCVVIGKNRGRESNFVLGVYDDNGKLVEVGAASSIGKPAANVGDVLELRYLYAGANSRLVQPTVLRLRPDKEADECSIGQLRFADKSVVIA